ncbi:hypothetical protein L1987_89251 [Smallanthus sonchifolius]|nr:hypothetical protein L1987_89251 [Smallanthus sonchifolius]
MSVRKLSLYTPAGRKAAGEGEGDWARSIRSEFPIQIEAPIKKILRRLRDRGLISRRRPWPIHVGCLTNVSDGDIDSSRLLDLVMSLFSVMRAGWSFYTLIVIRCACAILMNIIREKFGQLSLTDQLYYRKKKEVDRNEIRLAAIFDSDLILGEEVDWEAKADPSTSTASHDSQLRVAKCGEEEEADRAKALLFPFALPEVESLEVLSEVVLVLVHLCLDMIYHVTYALSCCNGVIAAHVRGHLLIHLMTDARPLLLLLQSILLLGSS